MALLTDLSGWAVAGLGASTVALPTLARGRLALVGVRWTRPRTIWLGVHYRVGVAIVGATVLHALLAMSAGHLPTTPLGEAGIWIASSGLILVLAQVAIGGRLRAHRGRSSVLRSAHLLVVAALVAVAVVHVVLNGSGARFGGGL